MILLKTPKGVHEFADKRGKCIHCGITLSVALKDGVIMINGVYNKWIEQKSASKKESRLGERVLDAYNKYKTVGNSPEVALEKALDAVIGK